MKTRVRRAAIDRNAVEKEPWLDTRSFRAAFFDAPPSSAPNQIRKLFVDLAAEHRQRVQWWCQGPVHTYYLAINLPNCCLSATRAAIITARGAFTDAFLISAA
jgi:hypothetical protein